MGQLPLQVCSWKAWQHLARSVEQQELTICSCNSQEEEGNRTAEGELWGMQLPNFNLEDFSMWP